MTDQATTTSTPAWRRLLRRVWPADLGYGTAAALAVCILINVIMQLGPIFKWQNGWPVFQRWNLWEWFIEDAAISFTYARNLVEGEGLVAFRGGERIEGFSNPLWVALMAAWYVVGVDGFWSAKLMALFFSSLTVILAWKIAQEIMEDEQSPAPLVAPLVLSLTPQFAFWNASGLENPLFNFCLAGGMWRVLVEARTGRFPWSSVWFLGLAVTRPEGIMYGAWGGFLAMVFALTQGRGLRTTWQWLATFFIPFTIYHAIRYNYFAWAFPNTYYAKLGDKEFRPFSWTSRGWKYIRNWASGNFDISGQEGSGTGWFLPVYFAGLIGLRGSRAIGWLAATAFVALCFLYPSSDLTNTWGWWPKGMYEPTWWKEGRVWGIFALTFGLPVASMSDRGSRGRVLTWGMAALTLTFCIYSAGDWMKGTRWMSFLAVPAAVLFANGVRELAGLAERSMRGAKMPSFSGWSAMQWVVAPVIVLALLPNYFYNAQWFFGKRETGPMSVKKRVDYTASVTDKLFLRDQLIRNLDVDMGAHTYWSSHQMVDMAGLVDVTVAHHVFSQRAVTKEYIFDEMKPQIAHCHGGWATNSKIPTFPEWQQGYFEVPPFPISSSTYHMGTFIRRDLVMLPDWDGRDARKVAFEDGLTLRGWRVPSPEVSQGKAFYMEVGVQYDKADARQDFRLYGFLSDANGRIQVFDLPPAYDWLPVAEWRQDEVFLGKFAPALEKSLEPGKYDLGFVFVGADGRVLQPTSGQVPDGVVIGGYGGQPARFAVGEVRFANALTIGDAGTGEKAARDDFERAMELARNTDCKAAEAAWRLAWLHLPNADKWYEDNRAELAPVLARCWAETARDAEDLQEAADALASARVWDHTADDVWEVAEDVGDRLMDQGAEARDSGDWEAAYDAYAAAIIANPSLSWARRYAEDARDHRLKIDEESVEKAKVEREQRMEKAKEAKEKAPAKPAEAPSGDGEVKQESQKPTPPPKPKATPRPAPEKPKEE